MFNTLWWNLLQSSAINNFYNIQGMKLPKFQSYLQYLKDTSFQHRYAVQ